MDKPKTNIKEQWETILQKGVDFEVTTKNITFLYKIGIKKKVRKFIIYPAVLGTLGRISEILSTIDRIDFDKIEENKNLFNDGLEIIKKNRGRILDVICLAIHNKKGEPPGNLKKYLEYNLTPKELLQLLILVQNQMDVKDFLAGSVSIQGLNLSEARKQTSGK